MHIKINNQKFNAELFSTPDELERGLMGRKQFDGCAVFNVGKGYHSFWMKNCLINLDIVFVLNNKITKIHSNCQAVADDQTTPDKYTGIGDYVLEFSAGTSENWKIGDRVQFVY